MQSSAPTINKFPRARKRNKEEIPEIMPSLLIHASSSDTEDNAFSIHRSRRIDIGNHDGRPVFRKEKARTKVSEMRSLRPILSDPVGEPSQEASEMRQQNAPEKETTLAYEVPERRACRDERSSALRDSGTCNLMKAQRSLEMEDMWSWISEQGPNSLLENIA